MPWPLQSNNQSRSAPATARGDPARGDPARGDPARGDPALAAGWPAPAAGWPAPAVGWPTPTAGWPAPAPGWPAPPPRGPPSIGSAAGITGIVVVVGDAAPVVVGVRAGTPAAWRQATGGQVVRHHRRQHQCRRSRPPLYFVYIKKILRTIVFIKRFFVSLS